jgi:FtsP/CotA-like multicopper oxidase with cupredoxin domain
VSSDRVQLSPGERAEVIVPMAPGEDVVLRSFAADLAGNVFAERFNGGQDEFDVLQLRAAERLQASPEVPSSLAPAPQLDVSEARTRRFELNDQQINGKTMAMSRVDETVELGTTEVWEVRNADGQHHNFHVHDVQFQVLSVDGARPGPQLQGWKDTVFLPPGGSVRLAMQFTDYADSDTPYMFHCHLLQHEDSGMMGQFVVVDPGQAAGAVDHSQHQH